MPTFYRPDKTGEIELLEHRRINAGISCEELAAKADMATRTWQRIRKDGRAWPRHIRAVTAALRAIERERLIIETGDGGK